jgi:hypothetical protein
LQNSLWLPDGKQRNALLVAGKGMCFVFVVVIEDWHKARERMVFILVYLEMEERRRGEEGAGGLKKSDYSNASAE